MLGREGREVLGIDREGREISVACLQDRIHQMEETHYW